MTLAQRIGQLAREQDLTQRCAKFFDVARYVTLEKDRIHDPAGQTATSKHIQQILKSVVAAGSTTGWGQPLAPYTKLRCLSLRVHFFWLRRGWFGRNFE
jgi:hypothetical protein